MGPTKRKYPSEGKTEGKAKKIRLRSPEPEPEPEPETEDEAAADEVGDGMYKVRNIIGETKTKYRVDWENASDGTEYDPTWEPKDYVNQAAVDDWEEKKRLKEEAKKNKTAGRGRPSGVGRFSTAGRALGAGRSSVTGRSSVAGSSSGAGRSSATREVVQIDDDEDDSEDGTPLKKKVTASASKPPVVLKISRRSNAVVEVTPPPSKLPESSKEKRGKPRTSLQPPQDDDEDTFIGIPGPAKRSVGRPRKSSPEAVQQERDQDGDGVDSTDPQPRRPSGFSKLSLLGGQAPRRISSLLQENSHAAGPSAVHQDLARPKHPRLSRPPRDDIEQGTSTVEQRKRKPGRRSSFFVGGSLEDQAQDESPKQSPASDIRRKPPIKPLRRDVYKIPSSDDDDSEVPLKIASTRQRRVIPESSDDEGQHVQESLQHAESIAAPKKGRGRPRKNPPPAEKTQEPKRPRGRPRKTRASVAQSSVTRAATSRPAELGTTEIEDSEIYDSAAAQLQREARSVRKTPPRQTSPEFDEEISEFRSSQILRGTQPDPARPAEQATIVDNIDESEVMVDAAAASSLSQKNSPYEPGTTSESIFDSSDGTTGLVINSSSGVHTLPMPLVRRFDVDVIIPDSQSYLDASSVHISGHQVDAQMEDYEDASTESQVAIIEQPVIEQHPTIQEHDIPESSIAQKPEDPRLPNVAAATQSGPSIETSTQDNINNEGIFSAASSPIAHVPERISTRSGSPVSVGAARSSSTSSAPPTESADKSTQSQHSHHQVGSPSQNEENSLQPQSALVPELNQDSDQNPESVQNPSTTTSQQSHVQQAAQQVSFEQGPDQPRLALDFLQSSVEENTTSSSSGFLTQVVPSHQLPTQPALSPEAPTFTSDQSERPRSAQSLSSFPTIPSQFPNTVGESAPSRIRSVSESGLTSGPGQDLSMSTSGSGNGDTPKPVAPLTARLRAMRAKIRAEYDAETERLAAVRANEKAARATSSAPVVPTVVAPVAPIDVLSPKPASAVPARLMSPALADRETRSPSTVPPVEIVPEETPEESTRSERYETLLPGDGPQINSNNSRNVVSQDSAMPDVSLDEADNNQHIVSIDFSVQQRDYYICSFNDKKALVDEFTERVWPEDADITEQARAYIGRLHNYVNHLDLNDLDTANSPIPPELQIEWDTSMCAKFTFLRSLLYAAKAHNLHVALLIDPGRLAAIAQTFLQGIDTMYNVIDGQNNVVNQNSTATILLTSVDANADRDVSSLELDMIVIIDGSTPSKVITRTQMMLSPDSPLPAISLVVPRSIEHAVRCIPAAMPEAERLHVLLSTATNERLSAGWVSGGTDTDFDRKASNIVSWTLNPAESDWQLYGLPELQLVEALSSQPSSEDELMAHNVNLSNGKRPLDELDLPMAKKIRVEEPLPLTINPADMHLPSGTVPVSHSHVSDSVAASQHAVTKQQLTTAQRQVREYEQAMERLQFDSEEQRASMVQAQLERNRALEREENLKKTNRNLQDKSVSLREEVLELRKQLESARAVLANHAVPERAELEQSRAEARTAIAEKQKQAKLAKTAEDQVEYLRDQYQTRSNDLTSITAINAEQEKRIAELEIKASGEQAKLRAINLDNHAKKLQSSWDKTKAKLAEKEAHCQHLSEENARLMQRGRGVSTRATSIPRSRPSSPAPVRSRHPLSKGSPA